MTTNRLAKSADPTFDRSKWSLAEHCEWANAQMILKDIPEYRRKKGLGAVRWVVRDGRIVIDNAPLARIEAFGRDRGTGLDCEATRAGSAPNNHS